MCNEVIDPYGFIYITTNLINGKRYIGQKKFDHKWKSYLGSGIALKASIKKYGKENFIRNIVDIVYTPEELNKKEYEWIENYNAVESGDYYNKIEGGSVFDEIHKRNSIPIVCLNNGMIFDSIADATTWSGHVGLTIRKTFKMPYKVGSKKLIFRLTNKNCNICNKAFYSNKSSKKKCDQCENHRKCKCCGVEIEKVQAKKYCTECALEKERERKRRWKANKKLLEIHII